MPSGQYRHQAIFRKHLLHHGAVIDQDATEANVDAPGFQRIHLLAGGHLAQPQFEFQRGIGAQLADQLGQHAIQRRGREADAQPGLLAQADAPGVVTQGIELVQQGRAVLVKITPGLGQPQRPAAFQQAHPDFLLELLDLPAQGRLGDMQMLGRAGEVQRLRHCLKIA